MTSEKIRRSVHRPAPTASWEFDHRWGTQLGDSTKLRVSRTEGGGMTIAYGKDSLEIRRELVEVVAEMVQSAAQWTDAPAAEETP